MCKLVKPVSSSQKANGVMTQKPEENPFKCVTPNEFPYFRHNNTIN